MLHADAADGLPKTIWVLWLQGFDAAPHVVQRCLCSWKKHNPDWRIVELTEKSLGEWLDLSSLVGANRSDITSQALSDIIRINLLANYGGVWVDSTCFCCTPLDSWLERCLEGGFFAFDNPGRDRLIASWFLASTTSCHLTLAYRDAVNAYWKENDFSNQRTDRGRAAVRRLDALLNWHSALTRFWFTAPVTRKLHVYPYYWFHYTLAEVIRRDERARQIWEGRFKYSADIPHRLQFAGLLTPPSDAVKHAIDEHRDPLYKLTWKHLPGEVPRGCTLDYLLNV